MNETKQKILNFLSQFVHNDSLGESEDIFALGFVNSMFAMQMVLFVEKEFEISVDRDDLDFENFRSIRAIADLVDRKKGLSLGNDCPGR